MTTKGNKTTRLMALALLGVLFLAGCSMVPKQQLSMEPPQHRAKDVLKESVEYPLDVYDPLEGVNRRVYAFNYYFDKFLYLPVVGVYEFIMPDYVEERVSNFVDNVFEFNNFTNNLLQFKFKKTGITLARIVVNSTVGIGGLWDPATGWNMPTWKEDFGQTLGYHGLGHGPFIVLPLLGPSNLRDTTGTVTDSVTFTLVGPPAWVDDDDVTLIFNGVAAIDKRHQKKFRYYQTGSPFEYEMVRMIYNTYREMEIAK
jgi:phospholipid-binding lipoprotein MlaA